MHDMPEFYMADGGHQIAAPTWQASAQLYIVMASSETGQVGPTLVEPGEHFTSDLTPSQAWIPLNRAAASKMQDWIDSQPVDGKGIPEHIIREAAYRMRPRVGEPEVPHVQWWGAVMKLAATMVGEGLVIPRPVGAPAYRPGQPTVPIMPFASQSYGGPPPQPGHAPVHVAQHVPQNPADVSRAARRQKVAAPMANTLPSESPQTVTG